MGSYKHSEVQIFSQSLSELYVTSFSLEIRGSQCSSWNYEHIMNLAKSATSSTENTFPGAFGPWLQMVTRAMRAGLWVTVKCRMTLWTVSRWPPTMWIWPSGIPSLILDAILETQDTETSQRGFLIKQKLPTLSSYLRALRQECPSPEGRLEDDKCTPLPLTLLFCNSCDVLP